MNKLRLMICGLLFACVDSSSTPKLEILNAVDLGAIGHPISVTNRDGGSSAIIAGKLLWTFGDTLFNPKSVDGTNLRSNTAALADPILPLVVTEPTDANGAPFQFLPFSSEEKAFNDANGSPNDRIALWTGSMIDLNGTTQMFYLKLHVKPGLLNYEFLGVGLASIAPNSTTATREPNMLFAATEPLFTTAMRVNSEVFVYGNLATKGVMIARVNIDHLKERSQYRFWNGMDWVADVGQAVAIVPQTPALSVSYNPYLQQFLAVSSGVFSNKVFFRTAPQPEGPWSPVLEAFTGMTPATNTVDYAGIEHPELAKDGGKTLFVTYYHPLGGFKGELRAVSVNLK
jgi:Domain of unknown function (DUF4185)